MHYQWIFLTVVCGNRLIILMLKIQPSVVHHRADCVPEVHVSLQSQGQDVGEVSSRTAATNQNHHSTDFRQAEGLRYVRINIHTEHTLIIMLNSNRILINMFPLLYQPKKLTAVLTLAKPKAVRGMTPYWAIIAITTPLGFNRWCWEKEHKCQCGNKDLHYPSFLHVQKML